MKKNVCYENVLFYLVWISSHIKKIKTYFLIMLKGIHTVIDWEKFAVFFSHW